MLHFGPETLRASALRSSMHSARRASEHQVVHSSGRRFAGLGNVIDQFHYEYRLKDGTGGIQVDVSWGRAMD
jgi:hypothetical protein